MTIIIIHEVYGVTENLRRLTTELEKKGCKVILPSLYSDNYSGNIEEYSYKKYFSEVGFEKSIRLIDRIIEENSKDNIFIIGFSIGATLAWMKSADDRVKGVIGFYGSRIRNYLRITPCIPTRLFFCNEESFEVENLIVELNKKQHTEVTKIPGVHGFYSKSVFNSELIQETNTRIVEELEKIGVCEQAVMCKRDTRMKIFQELEKISERPEPFQFYTASDLWTDEHTSGQMLSCHLNEAIDLSSRNAQFINRSVEWIASRFNTGKDTKIADFGCGPGLYTTALAKRQAKVTGIDFSRRSIEYAKDAAAVQQLNINYVTQNYLDFETEDRFDLVMMIMCDFCALSPAQRKGILSKFYKILKPGGSVLLDVYSLAAFDKREEAATYEENLLNGFWSSNKYYGFLNTFKYDEKRVVLDKYTIVEPDRTRTVYNWLQYFAPEELEREFMEGGFSIEALYSDVAGTPYDKNSSEFAVIAQRDTKLS